MPSRSSTVSLRERRRREAVERGDAAGDVLDADARQAHHRLRRRGVVVGDDDDRRVERQQRAAPRREVAIESDVDRRRRCGRAPKASASRTSRISASGRSVIERVSGVAAISLERARPAAVQLRIAREVARRRGQAGGQRLDELLARHRLQRPVRPPLHADRRRRLLRDVAAARRAGAVRGPDLDVIGQRQDLRVQRVVEHRRHLFATCSRARRRDRDGRRRR